jgi:hypothetical protein
VPYTSNSLRPSSLGLFELTPTTLSWFFRHAECPLVCVMLTFCKGPVLAFWRGVPATSVFLFSSLWLPGALWCSQSSLLYLIPQIPPSLIGPWILLKILLSKIWGRFSSFFELYCYYTNFRRNSLHVRGIYLIEGRAFLFPVYISPRPVLSAICHNCLCLATDFKFVKCGLNWMGKRYVNLTLQKYRNLTLLQMQFLISHTEGGTKTEGVRE